MRPMKEKLIAYALDFVSFLVQETKHRQNIKNIILFGSVSREEADKKSDVDLFIDLIKAEPKVENEFEKIRDDFMASVKVKRYWSLLGITNEVSLTVGKLEEWTELHPSLIANGIICYGKYKPEIKQGTHLSFFMWENIKPNSKRVLFNKQMFGYKFKGKAYSGLLQKVNGQRLGKGCISVPLESATPCLKLFRQHKITVKIKKVLEY